jgi:hypothetical protein
MTMTKSNSYFIGKSEDIILIAKMLTNRGNVVVSNLGFLDYNQGIHLDFNGFVHFANSVNQQDIKIKTREYV